MSRIKILSAAGAMMFCGLTAASSQTFTGDRLIFVTSPPLWTEGGPNGALNKIKLQVFVDNVLQKNCTEVIDSDNGWICKADTKIAPGKHNVKVTITSPDASKPITLRKTVTLRAADKKFENPDNPSSGEQFWCLGVNTKKIAPMPKTDERCHTD